MSTIKIPFNNIRALVDGNSFNEKDNTIEVVFATETPVKRYDWSRDRMYNEVLDVSSEAMDMGRLRSGAPVLNAHSSYDLNDVIGVVRDVKIDRVNKEARATLQLSQEDSDKPVVNKIKSGIIRNVSVGYSVSKYEEDKETDPVTMRAIRWQPMEISFVPVPADPNSGSRNNDKTDFQIVNIIEKNQKRMEENTPVPQPQAVATPVVAVVEKQAAPAVNVAEVRVQAVQAERQRVAEIAEICQRVKMTDEFTTNLIKEGKTVEESRAAVIDEVAKNANKAPVTGNVVVTGADETEQVRSALIDGLSERMKPGSVKDFQKNERTVEFRNMRLLDLAKQRLHAKGEKFTTLSDSEIVKRAWATTDYPDLFVTTIQRFLRRDYTNVIQDWQMIALRQSANDFRVKTGIKIDGRSQFQEIPEGGKYRSTPVLQDEKATIQLKRFGQMHNISYQTIINDDLAALARVPKIIGIDSQRLQSDTVWNLIINNVNTPDGKAIFDATSHKNYDSTGAALSSASLSAGRTALRRMKSPAGNLIGVAPRYLIVPPELETTAQQMVTAVLSTNVGDVNVFAGKFQNIVCTTLSDTKAWYLAADPNETTADGIMYAYLDGSEGVNVSSFLDLYSDDLVIKANMAFAASVWGYQGWYKNKGA